jgi:hypothetical protein
MTEQIKQPTAADPQGAGLTGEKLEQADEATDAGQTGTNSGGSADGSGTASTDGAGLT